MAKLKTGRHTGAIKTHRKSVRRMLRNRDVRKSIREAAKEFLAAVDAKDAAKVKELTPKVAALWDKAAKVGVVHRNAAARKKSRLAARAKAVLA